MNPGATGSPPPKTHVSGYKQKQIQQYTPEQMQLFQQMLESIMPGISGGTDFLSKLASGDQEAFDEYERPAFRDFEKLLGQIGTRFSHLGAQDSNYFENAVSGAGSELAENLASKRLDIRNKAIESLLSHSHTLLNQRPYENVLLKKDGNKGTNWGKVAGTAGGAGVGFLLGGPGGAAAGATVGNKAFS